MSSRPKSLKISNRGSVSYKELLIIPLISFFVIGFFISWVIGFIIGLLYLILYPILRFSTWIFYKELILKNNKLYLTNNFLNKKINNKLVTDSFDITKLSVNEIANAGKIKYLLQYKTHKIFDLLIVNDKSVIKNLYSN